MSNRKKSREVSVYIIDKHVLMRQILVSMLKQLTGIQVVGSAHSLTPENISLTIDQLKPDVILLGIDKMNSEEMDLFRFLRTEHPRLPVVLMTVLNREGAQIAISGLKLGAVDYITKPDCRHGVILAGRHFKKRVTPILKGISELNVNGLHQNLMLHEDSTGESVVTSGSYVHSPENIDIIVIGGCMGGVQSLFRIISKLPEKFPIPVVIVQHMPKIYTSELATQLDLLSPLHVREAKDNSPLLPGQIYVAPGGWHVVMKNDGSRKKLFLHRGPREHKSRPSVDVLLRSAVQVYGDRVLSLFLSGGGNDGIYGAELVKKAGGEVILESRDSALIWQTPEKIAMLYSDIKSYRAEEMIPEIIKIIHSPKTADVSRFEFKRVNNNNIYLENGFIGNSM